MRSFWRLRPVIACWCRSRERARALLVLTRQRPLVDVGAIIERAGVPVVERALAKDVRATVSEVAGRRAIIVNRNYPIRSSREHRWILAEEDGADVSNREGDRSRHRALFHARTNR